MEYPKKRSENQAEQIEELRVEWKHLWKDRFDDKIRAEGIANQDYPSLFLEKGTVILATRSFKLLTFKDILKEHGVIDVHRFVSPSAGVGGWGKFIKSSVIQSRSNNRRANRSFAEEKKPQQLRKGGRGWLHR